MTSSAQLHEHWVKDTDLTQDVLAVSETRDGCEFIDAKFAIVRYKIFGKGRKGDVVFMMVKDTTLTVSHPSLILP